MHAFSQLIVSENNIRFRREVKQAPGAWSH